MTHAYLVLLSVCRWTCVSFLSTVLIAARAEAQIGPTVVPGEDYRVELGAVFWTPSPDVLIRSDTIDIIGTDIDVIGEFGIEDEAVPDFRVTLKPGRKHKIRFEYIPLSYEGDTVLNRTIVFAGRTFSVNFPASAALDWKLWRFGYEWDFVSRERGYVGLVAELKYNHVNAEISAVGQTEIGEQRAPVPAIGITGRGYVVPFVSITGEFTGFKRPDSFDEQYVVEFWDFDLYGTVNIGRNVGVQGGYRSIDVEYLVDEDTGQLNFKGLYLGGVVRF